jgi:AP-1 complex subunit gamma-1
MARTAYDKNELKITLTPQTSAAKPRVAVILAHFQVAGSSTCAGPKVISAITSYFFLAYLFMKQSQQLQMLPMPNPDVNPGAAETQQMRVIAPTGVRINFSGALRSF